MKRNLFIGVIVFLGVFLCNYSAQASTEIKYGKPVPATWTKAGSPYIIIDSGFSIATPVIIEPGVVVKFKNSYTFISFASLRAVGTETEKIIFTSFKDDDHGGDTNNDGSGSVPGRGDWSYVLMPSGSQATIEYVQFLYGSSSPGTADFTTYSSNVSVKNSEMRNGLYNGVSFGYGAQPVFENNIITDNGVGVYLTGYYSGQSVRISNNVIAGNQRGVVIDGFIWQYKQTKLYAENNWWGDVSGPHYVPGIYYGSAYPTPPNLGGKGNAVPDGVSFSPWLGKDPLAPDQGCVENCFSSILFLPGLEASRLYDSNGRVWEPYSDSDAEKLLLDESGKSIRNDIYAKDVIDTAYLPIKGNIYKSFLEDLKQWKETDKLIDDYVVAPYDWRLSLDDILSNDSIADILRQLAKDSRTKKVTIIAHSNGGLVAKALVKKLGAEAEQLIDKIVFVAVPQSGTPQAVGAILHGYDQGLPVDWFPFALSPKTARTLAQNMPGAYNLLPSQSYFSGGGSGATTPVVTFDDGELTKSFIDEYGKKIDAPDELQNFLTNDTGKVSADSENTASPSMANSGLLSDSKSVHQTLDDLVIPSSISVYQIAGFGEETLGTIKYWTGEECVREGWKLCASRKSKLEYTPELMVDGDGTVAAPSALAMSTNNSNVSRWWVDLASYDRPSTLGRKHADIFEVPQLRDFIKDTILTQSTTILPSYLSNSEPPISSEKRLHYYLHSPLTLSARDSAGNEISATTSTIPGAEYRRFGEVQYISLPASSDPTVVLDGLAEGSFTLEAQEIEGDTVIAATTFSGIPTSAETKATMDFSDGTIAGASPLTVDYSGDGTRVFSLESKPGETVVFDTTSPVTTASVVGTLGQNDWYTSDVTVTLAATDEDGGSGAGKTEYSLDNGTTWNIYVDPFALSTEGTTNILSTSTDKQGNKEEIKTQSVKIDKTAPEARVIFNSVTQKLDIIGTDNLSQNVSVEESVAPVIPSENDKSVTSVIPSGNEESRGEKKFKESKEEGIKVKSTTTITDEAGHVTILVLAMARDKERRIVRTIESVSYDGIAQILPSTMLQYKWAYNQKKKTYEMLASNMKAGSKSIESHYIPRKNETWIMEKPRDLGDDEGDDDSEHRPTRTKLPGMVIPSIITEKGIAKIVY